MKARAPHLLVRCDQPTAGDADVRCSVHEVRNGTSFGIEHLSNLVWSSRSVGADTAPSSRSSSKAQREDCLGIGRGVPSFPLDATADTRLLVAVNRLPGEDGVDGYAQIATGHRLVIARATVVELPAIG